MASFVMVLLPETEKSMAALPLIDPLWLLSIWESRLPLTDKVSAVTPTSA